MMKRTNWLVVVAIALGLLVPAGTANAAPALARVFLQNSYLRFRAPTDRPVDLTLFLNEEGVVTLRDDFGRITPGPGCVAVSAREVECDHPAASNAVEVHGSPFDDLVRLRFAPTDRFIGFDGEGDDQFYGQAGDDLFFAGAATMSSMGGGVTTTSPETTGPIDSSAIPATIVSRSASPPSRHRTDPTKSPEATAETAPSISSPTPSACP